MAKDAGIKPRAVVVINPGNPTGQVMSSKCIQEIIKVCHEHNMIILADEVYQENIYKEGASFTSVRKALANMPAPYCNEVGLVSMNSISKGLLGECGLRGGYFETHNISQEANDLYYRLKSTDHCSNTVGQIGV